MPEKSDPTRLPKLPQYIGYDEVAEALWVHRRTVERMVENGLFPRPEQVSPNRVGWRIEVLLAHLDRTAKALTALAVTNPDDLPPEQLEPAICALGARLLSHESGTTVGPEQVTVRFVATGGSDDLAIERQSLASQLHDICKHFVSRRAIIVAARRHDGPLDTETLE
jgi:predicted DNA-binding transcriptional regulator AlpA